MIVKLENGAGLTKSCGFYIWAVAGGWRSDDLKLHKARMHEEDIVWNKM